jgi:hypothetical protein
MYKRVKNLLSLRSKGAAESARPRGVIIALVFLCAFISGCTATLKDKAYTLSYEASQLEPPANWRQKEYVFNVKHSVEEYSYSFKAKFKENKFPYYSCLFRGRNDPWLELEILELDNGNEIKRNLVAMYVQNGAYIEILMSGDMCDHYEILMTKISQDKISGYQTFQGWGHTNITGIININAPPP